MTQEEILEGNKLIAEFMGLKVHKNGMCDDPTKGVPSPSFGLKYHSSWDWLMQVVEKIEKLEKDSLCVYAVEIECDECTIHDYSDGIMVAHQSNDSKIKSVWLAVVDFIKRYNQNKQS